MFFVILVLLLIVALYIYGTNSHNYWRDRNINFRKPIPFYGNYYKTYTQKESQTQFATNLYNEFPKARVVGFFRGLQPRLLIRDPDIIRSVLSTDFQHFFVRGEGRDISIEPLLGNVFHAEGDKWKATRQRLTPAFSSGKLKSMFPLIVECAEQLQLIIDQKAETEEAVDVREAMARFSTDFIGACGFGVKINSINENNSQFREIGKKIIQTSLLIQTKLFLKEVFPKIFHWLKPFDQEVEDDFINFVKSIIDQRNSNPMGCNDFIDLLLELKNQGSIYVDSMEEVAENGSPKKIEVKIDLIFIAAQVFIFFAAGFETSSSATSYTLHQLAHNPYIQEKARQEVDRVLLKYDNKLCYDAVKDMDYLERCFSEGLRLFPSLGVLNRQCTKNFKVPGTEIVIEKGIDIYIPVQALHSDEKYYKNAEEFDPDRFLPDAARERHKFVYLPFGEGPRACIGTRLGQMQSIAGLAALLHRFAFEPVPGSRRNLVVDSTSNAIQSILGGVSLIIKRRQFQ